MLICMEGICRLRVDFGQVIISRVIFLSICRKEGRTVLGLYLLKFLSFKPHSGRCLSLNPMKGSRKDEEKVQSTTNGHD